MAAWKQLDLRVNHDPPEDDFHKILKIDGNQRLNGG